MLQTLDSGPGTQGQELEARNSGPRTQGKFFKVGPLGWASRPLWLQVPLGHHIHWARRFLTGPGTHDKGHRSGALGSGCLGQFAYYGDKTIVKRCSEQERTNLKQNIQVELKRKLEYVKKGALLSAGKNDGGNREQL